MTPAEFTSARQTLGLRRSELARLFETTDRTVRAWENDVDTKWRPIPFAVAMLLKLAVQSAMVRRELGILKASRAKGKQAKARRSPRRQGEPPSRDEGDLP